MLLWVFSGDSPTFVRANENSWDHLPNPVNRSGSQQPCSWETAPAGPGEHQAQPAPGAASEGECLPQRPSTHSHDPRVLGSELRLTASELAWFDNDRVSVCSQDIDHRTWEVNVCCLLGADQ